MQTKITLGMLPETRATESWLLQFPRLAHASGQLSESHSPEAGKRVSEKSGESGSEIAAGLEMDPLLLAALLHGACCLSLLELFLIKKIQR